MKNKLLCSFQDDLAERMTDSGFQKAWQESEAEYLLAKQVMEKRLDKKISQRELARKVKTSQAMISRVETMKANPSFYFLQRLATALDTKISIQFG